MGSESERIARLRALADRAQAELRRAATRIDVQSGYACPEPDCGLRYRHQHGDVWWPPGGEPWPPRRRTGSQP